MPEIKGISLITTTTIRASDTQEIEIAVGGNQNLTCHHWAVWPTLLVSSPVAPSRVTGSLCWHVVWAGMAYTSAAALHAGLGMVPANEKIQLYT